VPVSGFIGSSGCVGGAFAVSVSINSNRPGGCRNYSRRSNSTDHTDRTGNDFCNLTPRRFSALSSVLTA